MKKKFLVPILLILFVFSADSAYAWWFSWVFPNNTSSINIKIQNNTTKIQKNATKIQSNAEGIQSNTEGIQSNAAKIQSNTEGIQSNAIQIAILADLTNDVSSEIISQVFASGSLIGTTKLNQFKNYSLKLQFNKSFEEVQLLKTGHIENNSEPIYFKLSDCQGEPYYSYQMYFSFRPIKGKVISDGNNLYYYPQQVENIYQTTMVSFSINQQCSDLAFSSQSTYIKLLPNDPAVTGIYNYPFPIPITVEGLTEFNIITE